MTLIDTYESIVQFMLATMRTLGREHPQIAPMQSAQVKHLAAIIRNRSTEVEQIRSFWAQLWGAEKCMNSSCPPACLLASIA